MAGPSPSFTSFMQSQGYPVEYFDFEWEEGKPVRLAEDNEPTWSRTGYAARLFHTVLRLSGFKEVEAIRKSNLILGSPSEGQLAQLKSFQRMSHYMRTFSLGSKSGYPRVMKTYAQRVGSFPSFYPRSFNLPEEKQALADAFGSSRLWISKPGGGARGDGIVVIDKLPSGGSGRVVQQYIDNPLLINGLKFDLRFYVTVTSLDPLRIYVHENGLVRLATEPYLQNLEQIGNRSAHLTNFSINRHNAAFAATDDLSRDGTGNKWTHRPFWPFLESVGFDPADIKKKIDDAFVIVIMAARETFMEQKSHRFSFEVFGFDVMLDARGNIYVLEVNVTPAMGTSSKLDLFVKGPVLRDLFNLALIPKTSESHAKVERILEKNQKPEAMDFIHIAEYEVALRRAGQYRCIYPTKERVKEMARSIEKSRADLALEEWVCADEGKRATILQTKGAKFLEAMQS
jgi:hypothetical protein